MSAPRQPLAQVELEDEEHIVAHGSASTIWFVRVGDVWRPAAEAEGASVEALDAGPGMVWRRRITLQLPEGARVLRVESKPRLERKSPLEYLARRTNSAMRQQRRMEFRVGVRGKLERLPKQG